MNIEQLKNEKKKRKMTLQEISDLSGIPKRTVDDIFSGHTKNPRVDTLQAIEKALGIGSNITAEEYAEGAREFIKKIVTPQEDDLLYAFRKLSPALQDMLIRTAYTLAGEESPATALHKKA